MLVYCKIQTRENSGWKYHGHEERYLAWYSENIKSSLAINERNELEDW